MKSLAWLQWPTNIGRMSKAHAFIVTDGERSPRTLCHNYPGYMNEASPADPVTCDRCASCDGEMRARGRPKQVEDKTIYLPRHTFEEWAAA